MKKINSTIDKAKNIVVIQADNPDGDSLGSALALESILSEMDKNVSLFCGVDIPGYLRYLPGWDRVSSVLSHEFDMAIIVDTSSLMLLESLQKTDELKWLKSKPCVVIDHHATEATIDFAEIINDPKASSASEVIYTVAKENDWPLPIDACEFIASAILSDTLGLMSESVSQTTMQVMADLLARGVSLAKLDNARRDLQKKLPEILAYKGRLLERIEYSLDQKIATITIPWDEIEKYSPHYNPPMLVLDEMRQVEKVQTAIAFKTYPDGRITGKIRSNYGFGIADKLAEHFGGGGHKYAAGFRITDGRQLEQIKSETISKALSLLDTIKPNETS